MNRIEGKVIFQDRNFEIVQLAGGGKQESIIIFRGYQGANIAREGRSHSYIKWSKTIRDYGYTGKIFNYRWPSELVDGLGLELACKEAADCFWKIVDLEKPELISLLGFSSGGRIIQKIISKTGRSNSQYFNNVYLFGSLARNDDCWPLLLRGINGKIYNFFSREEETLTSWYMWLLYSSDISGISKIPFRHWRIENHDCSHFIRRHTDWEDQLERLLSKAGIDPEEI